MRNKSTKLIARASIYGGRQDDGVAKTRLIDSDDSDVWCQQRCQYLPVVQKKSDTYCERSTTPSFSTISDSEYTMKLLITTRNTLLVFISVFVLFGCWYSSSSSSSTIPKTRLPVVGGLLVTSNSNETAFQRDSQPSDVSSSTLLDRMLKPRNMNVNPVLWCTDSAYASWNCNCSDFDVTTGLGNVTDCLQNKTCDKCSQPDSCLDVTVSVNMRANSYDYQVCRSYEIWSLCLGQTVEVALPGNVLMDSCYFEAVGNEYCCKSVSTTTCGAAFCNNSLSFDVCALVASKCPHLVEAKTPSPTPLDQNSSFLPTASNETMPNLPFGGTEAPTNSKFNGGSGGGDGGFNFNGTGDFNGTAGIDVVWELNFICDNATQIPEKCGGSALNSSAGDWYSLVGNGHVLQLDAPRCSDQFGTISITILAGPDCEGLICVLALETVDLSCSSQVKKRFLAPKPAGGPLDFVTENGLAYFIHIAGVNKELPIGLNFPFDVQDLGPGITAAPSPMHNLGTANSTAAPSHSAGVSTPFPVEPVFPPPPPTPVNTIKTPEPGATSNETVAPSAKPSAAVGKTPTLSPTKRETPLPTNRKKSEAATMSSTMTTMVVVSLFTLALIAAK